MRNVDDEDPNLALIASVLLMREGGGILVTEEDVQAAVKARQRVVMGRSDDQDDAWVIKLEDVKEL